MQTCKQTTVVLTQPPTVQVQMHVVTVTYIPKSVVLHVATYIHEMSKVVVVVVKLLRWSFVVLNAYSNALDEPV